MAHMKTILFAPAQPDMQFQDEEVATLANTLGAKIVNGIVGLKDIFRELASDAWEIVWFASHGSAEGIHLTDTVLDGDTLSAGLRGTNAKLIVLNTCDSERSAEQIYASTSIPVLCNVGPVTVQAAFATSSRFADEIFRGRDVWTAYQNSRTKTFRLIPENPAIYARGAKDIERRVSRLEDSDAEHERVIRDMSDLIYGRANEGGIVHQMARLTEKLGEIRFVLWVLIGLFVATLATMVFLAVVVTGTVMQ